MQLNDKLKTILNINNIITASQDHRSGGIIINDSIQIIYNSYEYRDEDIEKINKMINKLERNRWKK